MTGRFPLAMAAVTLLDATASLTAWWWSNLGHTSCVCSVIRPEQCRVRCADRVFANTTRGMEPVFWEPQSGRKQSLTTPTSLYNGMSVVIIKLSAY